ncbi:MAG: 1-deoxy-D-xylulose-5-phosphate reductoisomerase, partial [Verrucomicrobiae bacterium]|nr:1-deoxy-D-xylulose-5-phosphate reductoisomerase [Verrucomicrobiae bacterium]
MKNVVLLGSTGSIGTSTIKVVEDLPDRLRLVGLAAGGNAELLLEQARRFEPEAISIASEEKAAELAGLFGTHPQVLHGDEGL